MVSSERNVVGVVTYVVEELMADRKVEVEIWQCFECDQDIEVRILAHDNEEAPNVYNVPTGCFLTCMAMPDEDDDPDDEPEEEYIVFCNAKCASACLAEYDEAVAPPDRETDPEGLPQ
jgi:hypothetical protein